MAERRRLRPGDLRWAAALVGLGAFLSTIFSSFGRSYSIYSLSGMQNGSIGIDSAMVGPMPLKFILAAAATAIIALLFLASRRAKRPDNSN